MSDTTTLATLLEHCGRGGFAGIQDSVSPNRPQFRLASPEHYASRWVGGECSSIRRSKQHPVDAGGEYLLEKLR
jgi:hypothetical protein